MRIHLSTSAQLVLSNIPERGDIEIPDGTSVGTFLDLAGVRPEHQKFILSVVNQEKAARGHILREGNSVFLMLPVGGG